MVLWCKFYNSAVKCLREFGIKCLLIDTCVSI